MNMLHSCNKGVDFPCIMLIKSDNGAVFGAFFTERIKTNKDHFKGSSDNFVFQIRPTYNAYLSSGTNPYYYFCDGKNLYIGSGGQGNALAIGDDLILGYSKSSETFNSPPLFHVQGSPMVKRDGAFTILCLEMFLLN